MNAMRERALCFTVTGEFLTSISRTLWADEGQPEKALSILKDGLHGINMEQVFAILTGSKKLIGDSNGDGVELVDDDAMISEHGFSLSLIDVLKKFRKHEDELMDWYQIATKQTVLVPSPRGLIDVPARRTQRYPKKGLDSTLGLKPDVDLDKIPYRAVGAMERRESMFTPENQEKRRELGLEPGEEGEVLENGWAAKNMLDDQDDLPPSPPPDPEPCINNSNGWLSPEGKFYRCIYTGHIDLAIRLGFNEAQLEKFGWLKMQQDKFWDSSLTWENFEVTQAQRDAVFDWCQQTGNPLPSWMAPEED